WPRRIFRDHQRVRFASRLIDVGPRLCNPIMLRISPVTAHRITMNSPNVVVSSHHRAWETFQNHAESARCDVEAAGLEPDAVRVRDPETVIFQVGVGNEMFAVPLIWVEGVGVTVECGNRHRSVLLLSAHGGYKRISASIFFRRTRQANLNSRCQYHTST